MYLKVASKETVKPSNIVSIVWQEHLIFTKNYNSFCKVLRKKIQHNLDDLVYDENSEHTEVLYNKIFGSQPKNIWKYKTMLDSLNLIKGEHSIKQNTQKLFLIALIAIIPLCFLLKPLYIHIDGLIFILLLLIITGTAIFFLRDYNTKVLKKIISKSDKTSFIRHLKPYEAMIHGESINNIIHGVVNELVKADDLKLIKGKLVVEKNKKDRDRIYNIALSYISLTNDYSTAVKNMSREEVFLTLTKTRDIYFSYCKKSKEYVNLCKVNLIICLSLELLAITRTIIGFVRDKPSVFIFMIALTMPLLFFLLYTSITTDFTSLIYESYKEKASKIENKTWQWSYFIFGEPVLDREFSQIAKNAKAELTSVGGGGVCGSCSSCSSCGGGCGGCGD